MENKSADKFVAARKRILYNAYNEYVEKSTLLDKVEKKVTENSVWDFKDLFESSALILNDIQLDNGGKELLEYGYYADLISTYMNRRGLLVEFEDYDINTFFAGTAEAVYNATADVVDDNDVYYYRYETIKKTYNILNKNNQVLYYDEPMIYPIEITFRISAKDQSAVIVSILPIKSKNN